MGFKSFASSIVKFIVAVAVTVLLIEAQPVAMPRGYANYNAGGNPGGYANYNTGGNPRGYANNNAGRNRDPRARRGSCNICGNPPQICICVSI
ncbi:hypothetical protein Bca4012_034163 [Brassica carinata]|uniref:Glycine-rich protein n=3 Tax=Brassica TaxID=3705 RepID=A0A0D3C4X9_BRAOL|nr:hypothetical protein HID58_063133 [Brassica napus]CAF1868525.1 unnamed protein product [Brassica napus]VDD15428.1 unnamed protein product [Brassica oleracea]